MGICSYAWMDIEARPHQCVNIMIIDTQATVPDGLRNCFKVLKKCQNKFACLINEMLHIKQLRPCLYVQSDSIRAKVFV